MMILLFFYIRIFQGINHAVKMNAVCKVSLRNNEEKIEEKEELHIEIKGIPSENLKTIDDLKKTLKFSKGLFVMYLMYSLTTIPFCIIWVIDANQEMSEYYLLYSWLFFKLCSAATPVVYSLFHSSISQSYKFFIYRFILHKQMKPSDDEAPIKKKKKTIKSNDYFTNL